MMPKSSDPRCAVRTTAVCVLSVLLAAVSVPAAPQSHGQERPQEGATITPNYKDADLSQIIQAVAEVTGKNFIIDPRVNAKVTMLSATPMSPAAFYEAFLAVLQVYGYVAVPAGKVIKIIPNTDARQLPSVDLPNSVSSTSDEIVTQIITMKNVSAAQLVPLLRPLIPQQGHLAAYPSGNMLIISDRASNVSRIMKIIERMDESGDEPIDVIPLHNASATELVRTINQLNQGAAGGDAGGAAVKVVADERTNSVLISGEKSLKLKAKALVLSLDTPRPGVGDTEVRYLLYADAEKLADKLKGQASASSKAQAGPGSAGAPAAAAGGGGSNVDASVTIWADVPTNALIMTAPPKIMKNLMAVIDKLDIRRAQVAVEALIVEVAVNKTANIGVQWLLDGGNNLGYGVTNLPGAPAPASSISAPQPPASALTGNLSTTVTGTNTSGATGSITTGTSVASQIPNGATFADRHVQLEHQEGLRRRHSGLAQRRHQQHHLDPARHHHEQRGGRGQGDSGDSAGHRPVHELDRGRERHDQPLRDDSARGGRHDSQGDAAHQRGQYHPAQGRAGRLLAGREARQIRPTSRPTSAPSRRPSSSRTAVSSFWAA